MILYLIRHGHAEDRLTWGGSDMERPLITKGIARAEKAFSRFITLYEKPALIISSAAVRALHTAEILRDICGSELVVRQSLNPGAAPQDYAGVIEEFMDATPLALVGHEPDLSEFISDHVSGGEMVCEFKKGSICHIENRMLVNLIQQKVLL